MSSLLGQTLSHYRVTERIGAGRMGEVYRATDTNLGRDVAIKVLPAEVAGDPERLARFRREARLLASLNHPNIAAIYGIEESEGGPFLALELVDGEDLKQRLDRGAIPVDESLEIALQVAEALEEAHGKGIVHRDLKPANVKVAPDGKVKVLDFGLAKAWASEAAGEGSSASALSQSPTMARGGTMAGVVLGTAAYMSPEQARGKAVDKRADVWSFGVLLWEMLTGRALFTGETVTDVIAAVVSREPDLGALPATTPAAVRRLIARCLRKDPRQRLPDIGAARLDLQEVTAGGSSDAPTSAASVPGGEVSATERRSLGRERLAWAAVTIAAVALAGAMVFRPSKSPPADPSVHFAIDPPEGWSFAWGWPVPSPDGRQVAFMADRAGEQAKAGQSMLWIRDLQSPAMRPLPATEGPFEGVPFWSPDSRSVAFFTGDELRKLRLEDGAVQRICSRPSPDGVGLGDWNAAGMILFSSGGVGARIYSVAASGGEPQAVTKVEPEEGSHQAPQFLPDGRRFLFLVGFGGRADRAGTYLSSLERPQDKRRIAPDWRRHVHASRHVLMTRDGSLLAQGFDPTTGSPEGGAVAIASAVGSWYATDVGFFGVSPRGTLAYFSAPRPGPSQLAWVDRNGKQIATVGEPDDFEQIALSPDGKSVAIEVRDAKRRLDLWVMDLARGVKTRVTATPDDEYNPVWSPDGRSLAFCVSGAGAMFAGEMKRKGLRVGDSETVVLDASAHSCPESWSKDGRTMLGLRQRTEGSGWSAWALTLDGKSQPEPLLRNEWADEPQISPDGRWLAYVSGVAGSPEVYIEPFRREGERVRVSAKGGGQPKWRADGRELFYSTPDGPVLAVEVRTQGDSLTVSSPTRLFSLHWQSYGTDDFAPSGDGQRFLVKIPVQEMDKPQLHIVTNWTSLLRQ